MNDERQVGRKEYKMKNKAQVCWKEENMKDKDK